jgi:hypothetical protein
MEDNSKLIWYLSIWIIAAGVVVFRCVRKDSRGAGLSLAYLLNLWMLYWVASALYVLPQYSYCDPDDVVAGLEQSAYAVVAFSAGYLMLTCALGRAAKSHFAADRPHVSDTKVAGLYIGVGAACTLLSLTKLAQLPTVTSLITGAANLAVVGLMLKSWHAWRSGKRRSFWLWLLVSLAYPLLTVITQGMLGYGIDKIILVCCFVAGFYRPRWRLLVLGLAAVYLGLSVYVTYMRDRSKVRDVVGSRIMKGWTFDQLKSTFSQAEFFSISNDEHLWAIDHRLNLSAQVGAAVHYIESGRQEFARGETLWEAILALIPRVFWPDKPVGAGSFGLVSKYTGIIFAEDISVGIGHVMELFINFGQWGVIIGFLGIGVIIALIDKGAGESLANNDWLTFPCWYMPGIAFLNVGGSFVETTATAAASLAVALLVKWFVRYAWQTAIFKSSATVASAHSAGMVRGRPGAHPSGAPQR